MRRDEKTFNDIDWEEVDFANGGWSWGRGGHPHEDHEYSISHTADDDSLTETRYKMPECISRMLMLSHRHGAEEARSNMRSALDV